ncbi:hypothetical protein MKEN_01168800 [Mycena kentingensis (nom. inval.)]|nr:hypothetical protein MKEN_01168800 [Mycena kentingensis (nom. inval.)]
MSAHLAIVDDHDPLVVYSGTWVDQGIQEEFQRTTRCSTAVGARMSFAFEGTTVAVYGSVKANAAPYTLSFTVDDASSQSYSPPTGATSDAHHQLLYTVDDLPDGAHKLLATVTSASPGSACAVQLDYITFTTTSTDVPAYYFDDRDPELLYQPVWLQTGSDQDFMHTSQKPQTRGGSNMTFQFMGRGISVHGAVDPGLVGASFILDGGAPVPYRAPSNLTALSQNTLFYTSPMNLGPEKHTLVFAADGDLAIWLDYLLVLPLQGVSENTSTGTAPALPSTVSRSTSTSDAGSSSALIPASSSRNKLSIALAIAGPLGGVLVLGLLLTVLLICVRRRRRQARAALMPDPLVDSGSGDLPASPWSTSTVKPTWSGSVMPTLQLGVPVRYGKLAALSPSASSPATPSSATTLTANRLGMDANGRPARYLSGPTAADSPPTYIA